jgi:hypothetical protein
MGQEPSPDRDAFIHRHHDCDELWIHLTVAHEGNITAVKISKLQPGMTVWNVQRRQMGNTTLRDTAVFSILVKEIDPEGRYVIASWNYNQPERFYSGEVSKWRAKKPITVAMAFGSSRLANREELKLINAQKEIDACQPVGENCDRHRSTRYATLKVDNGRLKIKFCNECRREQGLKPLY